MTCMQLCALDTIHHAAFKKLETKLTNELLWTHPSILCSTLLIALGLTVLVYLTYAVKTLQNQLQVHSQMLLQVLSQVRLRAHSQA